MAAVAALPLAVASRRANRRSVARSRRPFPLASLPDLASTSTSTTSTSSTSTSSPPSSTPSASSPPEAALLGLAAAVAFAGASAGPAWADAASAARKAELRATAETLQDSLDVAQASLKESLEKAADTASLIGRGLSRAEGAVTQAADKVRAGRKGPPVLSRGWR